MWTFRLLSKTVILVFESLRVYRLTVLQAYLIVLMHADVLGSQACVL